MLTEQQRQDRVNGIGGSDIGVILGLSSFKTPYQLWRQKKGLDDIIQEESQYQYWGTILEPTIRAEFEKRNNVSIKVPEQTEEHFLYPFIRGNFDGIILGTGEIWEGKCANPFVKDKWGEPGTNQIPPDYLAQVAFYCSIQNCQRAHISVLIGGNDYREYKYERDWEFENKILDAAVAFWHSLESDNPPEPINIDDLKLLWPKSESDKVKTISCLETERLILNLSDAKSRIKELEKFESGMKFELMKLMEDAEILTDEKGKVLATYKTNKKGTRTLLIKECFT